MRHLVQGRAVEWRTVSEDDARFNRVWSGLAGATARSWTSRCAHVATREVPPPSWSPVTPRVQNSPSSFSLRLGRLGDLREALEGPRNRGSCQVRA